MSFTNWAMESRERIDEEGVAGAKESLYELYIGALRRAGHVYNYGTSVYERDWDVLLVLDACRVDLMEEVDSEYAFLDQTGTHTSVASSSAEWMQKTFDDNPAEAEETIYVTGNPFSADHLDDEQFYELDEVWRYGWDESLGTIPPRPITDRAITHRRQHPNQRMIVHYMQPHYPFVPTEMEYSIDVSHFGAGSEESVWDDLRQGRVDREEVWRGYRENLHYVLDDLQLLLENIDAETAAITADHGNALGERYVYGHPEYVPFAALKHVPWYTTTVSDAETYEPELSARQEQGSVEQRLEDLGYI